MSISFLAICEYIWFCILLLNISDVIIWNSSTAWVWSGCFIQMSSIGVTWNWWWSCSDFIICQNCTIRYESNYVLKENSWWSLVLCLLQAWLVSLRFNMIYFLFFIVIYQLLCFACAPCSKMCVIKNLDYIL